MEQAVNKRTFDSLFPGLEQILRESESALTDGFSDPRELIAIADYVTQIRLAIADLKRATAARDSGQAETFGNLESRFFSLEGRIKEMRNDLMAAERCLPQP